MKVLDINNMCMWYHTVNVLWDMELLDTLLRSNDGFAWADGSIKPQY
jgi:hypothetical protein